MKRIETVMVILDKPKHPQVALTRALALARSTGAKLQLKSFCWLPMVAQKNVFDAQQRRAMKASVVQDRTRWLEGQVLDAGLSAADVTTAVIWTEDIASWVRDYVAEHAPDLVVKSVHPSKTLLHTPLDWQLLRESPAPLLLVSTRRRRPTGNVLATLDLRSTDRRHRAMNLRVLAAAQQFAAAAGGRLHCVSAVEYSTVLKDLDFIDVRKKQKQAKESARVLLDAMLAPYDVPRTRVHMPAGKVGQVVAEVARKIDADLLVVGTGARFGLGAALIGNSAEKILMRAPCDVLVLRPDSGGGDAAAR